MNDEQQKNWAKRKSIPTAPEDIRKLGTGKILLYATANAIGQRINTILPKLSLLSAMASTIKMGKNSIAVWHVCVCVHLLRSHFHFYGTQEYIKPNCVIYFTIYFHSIGVCLSFHNHIYFGWLLFLALFLYFALSFSLRGSLAPWLPGSIATTILSSTIRYNIYEKDLLIIFYLLLPLFTITNYAHSIAKMHNINSIKFPI